MKKNKKNTEFAPAERATAKTIKRQKELILKVPYLKKLYDSISEIVLILNKERQIVFFNESFARFLKAKDPKIFYGMRPGEALGCLRSSNCLGGCGTTRFCSACNVIDAILKGFKGKPVEQECRILKEKDSLDLFVKVNPLKLGRDKFIIFTAKDISHEKRRKALERIFFHDVSNIASSLYLASELLLKEKEKNNELETSIYEGIKELIAEISSQKILSEAENFDLSIKITELDAQKILEEAGRHYQKYAKSREVNLKFEYPKDKANFKSDKNILLRVLGNMIKNAIEGSKPKDNVIIGCALEENRINFYVQNSGLMPKKVQYQIFQRSFSTKGDGRGLGTYSMKLLSEKYLNGQISFVSSKKIGTIFTASYPTA